MYVLKNNELNIVLFKVGCNKMISVFDQKYSGLSREKKGFLQKRDGGRDKRKELKDEK